MVIAGAVERRDRTLRNIMVIPASMSMPDPLATHAGILKMRLTRYLIGRIPLAGTIAPQLVMSVIGQRGPSGLGRVEL